MTDESTARTRAVEALALKLYESAATKSAPEWADLPAMQRYHIMDHANELVNDVLTHFTPESPDHAVLALRMGLLADEIEAGANPVDPLLGKPLLKPALRGVIARAIRMTIEEGSDYGAAREGGSE